MLRFRWKHLLIPAVLAGVMCLAPDDSSAQRPGGGPGGGGGPSGGGGPGGGGNPWGGGGGGGQWGGGGGGGGFGRGGGGFSADGQFDSLLKTYGGSGDTLDYSKIPADERQRRDAMSQRFGGQPMPTSGTISRADFKTDFDKKMAAAREKMNAGGFGGPPGGGKPVTPGGDSGNVIVVGGPGGGDGKTVIAVPPGGGGGPPGGGWGGGGQMTAESRFKQIDTNQDGKISREEAQAGSQRLANSFDQNDTNKDGFIDQAEFTVYFNNAMSQMNGGGGNWGGGGGNWGGGGGNWGGGNWGGGNQQTPDSKKQEDQEEPKPVVYRYGNLPQGLPAWFTEADTDKDGQIGLYEWVKYWDSSETKLAEFKALDLNGDGLLTVEEYARVKKINLTAPGTGAPGKGGAPSWGNQPGGGQPWGPPPGGGIQAPPAPPTSPGQVPEEPKKDKPADPKKDEVKKEERPGGNRPGGNGDQGGGKQRPMGPGGGGDTGGGRQRPGGGGNPFNPGGGGGGK